MGIDLISKHKGEYQRPLGKENSEKTIQNYGDIVNVIVKASIQTCQKHTTSNINSEPRSEKAKEPLSAEP